MWITLMRFVCIYFVFLNLYFANIHLQEVHPKFLLDIGLASWLIMGLVRSYKDELND